MADSTADKARKARSKANDAKYYGYGTAKSIANKVAKTATGKDLTYQEEERAAKIIRTRRINDTARTAARATFIERRTEKKASEKRMNAAVGGGEAPKKKAPKPATKKVAAAVKKLQQQVSPKGVKKTESGAKKAIDKKYPGLYKKSN